ncbi:TRAP transporter 4TM/12TM fusion protein [Azospirillum fermentarium]|uniref:TRAP transporter permease n=1 Tax=Azospirillum fermentarium TaxID=1233114 RepID=UPI002227B75A|nr:TRAP transporter fused permease subunit [Azospirillum fermentarium]MCW2247609.1 TRAP transporter 4TM/12TM fusion protein [Azospirillum fermentarium]
MSIVSADTPVLETPIGAGRRTAGLALCGLLAAFVVWTTLTGRLASWVQLETVLMLALGAVFLLKPGPLASRSPALDLLLSLVLVAGGVFAGSYMILNNQEIAAFREGLPNDWDLASYVVGTLVVLEGARRVEGWTLLAVVLAGIAYLLFGNLLPGWAGHRGMSAAEMFELAYSPNGIFGVALGSVVEIVYIYVIFGVVLRLSGASDFFDWISGVLSMGRRSGSAQCAIIASALFGSINGSAPANVVANGAITISMMHKAGFTKSYAGAVEASSSVVGQIMPPVMGVGAFIMADITGVPYANIMLAAIVPSFLFIMSLSCVTALEAAKLGIQPPEGLDGTWTRERVLQAGILIAAFGVLLTMLFAGYSVDLCGLGAMVSLLVLSSLFRSTRPTWRKLRDMLVEGGLEGLSVAVACAAIGIIIGAVSATGLGIKISQGITALGATHLFPALLAAAACALLLGMGLPTAASYLLVVFTAGPALTHLGLPVLTAHMFIFYFAVMSAITPPVALAVFAAAAIAQEPVGKIAWHSLRLCLVAFLFPFLWIYQPELMLQDLSVMTLPQTVAAILALILAVIMLSAVLVGYFRGRLPRLERSVLAVSAALIYIPEPLTTAVGFTVGGALLARRLIFLPPS